MINKKKVMVAAGSLAVGAVIGAGVLMGNGIAQADSPSPSPSGSSSTGSSSPGSAERGPRGGNHTAVTGDELAKVTAAVQAKDAAVTVESVMKDEDGSYDVMGTKDGARVRVEVSADLATVSAAEAAGDRGKGGPRGGNHTAVTGDELAKVTAAVQAKDAAVTVESVMKDEDGSYDVMGTKDGARVRVEVSADLATIEVKTGR